MATKKPDNKAWDEFVAWCQKRGVSAIPANPWTLAAYARWCEPNLSHADIVKAFKTIFRVHNTKTRKRPDRDPLVVGTLAQIGERAKEKKERAKDKRKPLFPDDDILKPKAPKKAKKTAKKTAPSKTKAKTKGGKKGTAKEKAKKKTKTGGKKTRKGLSSTPKLVSKRKLKK